MKFKKLTDKEKKAYANLLNDLNKEYTNIFIHQREEILKKNRAFFLGIIIALISNYLISFLSRYLPKNIYFFIIELSVFIGLIIILISLILRTKAFSRLCKRDLDLFEDFKKLDNNIFLKGIEQDIIEGRKDADYLDWLFPYLVLQKIQLIKNRKNE